MKILERVRFLFLGLAIFSLSAMSAVAQQVVTGVVTDNGTKAPLPTVNILEVGTSNGTITDNKGRYKINVKSLHDTLRFSFIGYKTKKVLIRGDTTIDVALEPTVVSGNQLVVVGFGKKKQKNVVGAVTTIKPELLEAGGTDNMTNMLAGRVAGLIAFQRSGAPGENNSKFFIRGLSTFGTGKRNPLILIDGIESSVTDMAHLQPDNIASFSVLKDASAEAVYGSKAANGVIIIKTKSGHQGKTQFSVREANKISLNTRDFHLANNVTYMKLANEAALTRDPTAVLPYSQAKIVHTKAGENPLLYPSNHWLHQLIKPTTLNQHAYLSASGGGKQALFFVAGSYTVDHGNLKVNGINNFNNNIKLSNFTIRSNINLNLTPTTRAILRVKGLFGNYSGPIGGGDQIYRSALSANPVKFPALYPHHLKSFLKHPLFGGAVSERGGTTLLTNPYAEMVKGYQRWKQSNMSAQVDVEQGLNFVTPGLHFHVMGYLKRYAYFQVSRAYNPFFYSSHLDPSTDTINLNPLNNGNAGSVGTTGTAYLGYDEGGKDVNAHLYVEARFNYKHSVGLNNNVSGMLIGRISQLASGNAGSVQQSLPTRHVGISGRYSYNYAERYYAQFDFGFNGSERFAKNHRYGFFPSIGIAYRISNEKWFQPLKSVVSNLKLRATYGITGNSQIGNTSDRFFYLSEVNVNNGTYGSTFGEKFNNFRPGVSIDRYKNLDVTWEKARELDLGINLGLFNGSITMTADVYHQWRYNILQQRAFLGPALGISAIPKANTGKAESKGLDLAIHYNKRISKNWSAHLRATLTLAHSKVTQFAEVNYPANEQYRSRVGHPITQQWGYIAERLFVDEQEVKNSPQQMGDYTGGDIKYYDVNRDRKITDADEVPIGWPTQPEIEYGFGGTLGFKNFQFSFFFTGQNRVSFFIDPGAISPFVISGNPHNNTANQTGLLRVMAKNHWSEKNRNLYAFWPRLSPTLIANNDVPSTWWLRNGSFIRLKQVKLAYNLPKNLSTELGLNNMRFYVTATNLAVISPFKLWDPEMGGNGLGYPLQKVFNFGIKVNF